ncbi:hypothetical protein [Stappia sp. ICDLI1TA098]|jgi:hypothetical protein
MSAHDHPASSDVDADACRAAARRFRLSAAMVTDPEQRVVVRLTAQEAEAVARVMDTHSSAIRVRARYERRLAGLRATRPYRRACERERGNRDMAWLVAGVFAVEFNEWVMPLIHAVLS